EHGHRDAGVRAVAERVLQVRGEEDRRQQLVELHVRHPEPLPVTQKVLLVVLGGVDAGRARVREQPHEQGVVRRGRPRCIAPPAARPRPAGTATRAWPPASCRGAGGRGRRRPGGGRRQTYVAWARYWPGPT